MHTLDGCEEDYRRMLQEDDKPNAAQRSKLSIEFQFTTISLLIGYIIDKKKITLGKGCATPLTRNFFFVWVLKEGRDGRVGSKKEQHIKKKTNFS